MQRAKLLAAVVFVSLVAENETVLAYYHEMWTPARLLGWFTFVLPIKLSVFQLLSIAFAFGHKKGATARPISTLILVSAAALAFAVVYGIASGGQLKPIYTQVIAWISCLIFAIAAMTATATVQDFRRLENAIVMAGLWRSCCAIAYYMMVRGRDWEHMPQYMTTHEDTVVFVVTLLILLSRAIELRTRRAIKQLALAAPLVMLAIQVNNRRLAWATLAGGLLVLYFLLPAKSRFTRVMNRWLLRLAPAVILYVAIGWGRTEKIFAPLKSLSSMSGETAQVDNSTKARENENTSLIAMIKDRPLLGTGLGIEWKELDSRFTVPLSVFPLYHYSPHNSVLAFVAFLGGVGFAGLWLVLPASVYLNVRTYRRSTDPAVRSVAAMGVVETVAYLNQAYGDMGAMGPTHVEPATILGIGIAAAARLSVQSGAWPSPKAARGRQPG